ncbi:MAG TPA: hypothetical protein VNX68_00915, partial [Nitrosopumilaceae archaeon]|nr:hypothetical protein [Nitrosopumilaceae archaeon]
YEELIGREIMLYGLDQKEAIEKVKSALTSMGDKQQIDMSGNQIVRILMNAGSMHKLGASFQGQLKPGDRVQMMNACGIPYLKCMLGVSGTIKEVGDNGSWVTLDQSLDFKALKDNAMRALSMPEDVASKLVRNTLPVLQQWGWIKVVGGRIVEVFAPATATGSPLSVTGMLSNKTAMDIVFPEQFEPRWKQTLNNWNEVLNLLLPYIDQPELYHNNYTIWEYWVLGSDTSDFEVEDFASDEERNKIIPKLNELKNQSQVHSTINYAVRNLATMDGEQFRLLENTGDYWIPNFIKEGVPQEIPNKLEL